MRALQPARGQGERGPVRLRSAPQSPGVTAPRQTEFFILRKTKGGAVTSGLSETRGGGAQRLSDCALTPWQWPLLKSKTVVFSEDRDCPRIPEPAKVAGTVQPSIDSGLEWRACSAE